MQEVRETFKRRFEQAASRARGGRRIGLELKLPLVKPSGEAADRESLDGLWKHLEASGWQAEVDSTLGCVVGARTAGEENDTVASCETGYCKTEFSIAHAGELRALEASLEGILAQLRLFSESHDVAFLGYGIQPVARPGRHLLMKKSRSGVWDRAFRSNRHVPPEDGDDMHLFTLNASSHVHVSVSAEEAVRAVNVLNGFAGAQIALTAHSSVWMNAVDPLYRCVAGKMWDWWIPDGARVGVPEQPFSDLDHYIDEVARFRPVFVRRGNGPVVLDGPASFREFVAEGGCEGFTLQGERVRVEPGCEDFDDHSTCYWFDARISRYFTVENRSCDTQPPRDFMAVPALTLGLVSALDEAEEVLAEFDWQTLRTTREAACRNALGGTADGLNLRDLVGRMLDVAERGLRRRGLGEEEYLQTLKRRLSEGRCPADDAEEAFRRGGASALVEMRSI